MSENLENAVERAVVIAKEKTIGPRDLLIGGGSLGHDDYRGKTSKMHLPFSRSIS
jgi:hypothetical protein